MTALSDQLSLPSWLGPGLRPRGFGREGQKMAVSEALRGEVRTRVQAVVLMDPGKMPRSLLSKHDKLVKRGSVCGVASRSVGPGTPSLNTTTASGGEV